VNNQRFVPSHPLNTAVLFLVFNRPNVTVKVFEAIRKAKPPRFYIAADGARKEKNGEEEKVRQVRKIATQVDWDCEVKMLFREENLGCGKAVSSAITWFFEHEEMGIILEDDCLPNQSFFWFCEELLERYKDDMRVWHIAGNNFNISSNRLIYNEIETVSYVFSSFAQVWGWASWRRAWQHFDYRLKTWPSLKSNKSFVKLFPSYLAYIQKASHIDLVYAGRIDTWDYQWQYALLSNHGLAVVPISNLISNIGYGVDSTHIIGFDQKRNNLPLHEISLSIKHPTIILPDFYIDRFYATKMGMGFNFIRFIKMLFNRLLK